MMSISPRKIIVRDIVSGEETIFDDEKEVRLGAGYDMVTISIRDGTLSIKGDGALAVWPRATNLVEIVAHGGSRKKEDNHNYQEQVDKWLHAAFSIEVCEDKRERTHRFLEEALELAQAAGCSLAEVSLLVNYVYGRPTGEIGQEVGGVVTTLAAFCATHKMNMMEAAWTELARCWVNIEKIRVKQATKPKHSPLPQ